MATLNSVNDVLDFAIEREQEAVDFYNDLAGQTDNASLKKVLTAFADVERGHKTKLQAAKLNEVVLSGSNDDVVDLKIGDYLIDVQPGPDMSFQDALVVAIKREKAAMDLYADLAGLVSDSDLQTLFNQLAREEGTHKLKFETAYEEHFLSDN